MNQPPPLSDGRLHVSAPPAPAFNMGAPAAAFDYSLQPGGGQNVQPTAQEDSFYHPVPGAMRNLMDTDHQDERNGFAVQLNSNNVCSIS